MSLFFLTFFLIYGGVHCYAFLKFRSAFSPGPAASACLILFLVLMAVAPFLVRVTERHGFEEPARVLAYTGYSWMGFLFLFFCASLVLDVYRLVIHMAGLALHWDLSVFLPSARSVFLMAFAYGICISVYGFFEALNVRTERLTVSSPKIPAGIGRIRVVQVSDVHLGLMVGPYRLQRIVGEIRAANPDMLVSTGDLVDGQIDGLSPLVDPLRDIKTKYGKFAVTGNHEYYAGIGQALDFTRKAGFAVLEGSTAEAAGITVAGVSDPTGYRMGIERKTDERELLSKNSAGRFMLFLKHRPAVEKESLRLYDLQLSGHIHGGQIFPFSLVTRIFYPLGTGFKRLAENSDIYVSRGTGTWGPPIRFMAPPEVTVIDLVHGNGDGQDS